jgi:hypothetical protein
VESLKQSETGSQMEATVRSASPAGQNWLAALQNGELAKAYLETLPAKQREPQLRAWLLGDGAAPLAPSVLTRNSPELAEFHKGVEDLRKGKLIDASDLWIPARDETQREKIRAKILASAQELFSGKKNDLLRLQSIAQVQMPAFSRRGDRAEIGFPIKIEVLRSREMPRPTYIITGEVVIEGPLTKTVVPASEYRVIRLRVLRGANAVNPEQVRQ